MAWTGYRAPQVAGGGRNNGYFAPKATQRWDIGQIVNVGFVKGLVVQGRNGDGSYSLWSPSTFRRYAFTPHIGLYRED